MATKRNVLGVLMGIELVLNGANLNFVAFGSPLLRADGPLGLGAGRPVDRPVRDRAGGGRGGRGPGHRPELLPYPRHGRRGSGRRTEGLNGTRPPCLPLLLVTGLAAAAGLVRADRVLRPADGQGRPRRGLRGHGGHRGWPSCSRSSALVRLADGHIRSAPPWRAASRPRDVAAACRPGRDADLRGDLVRRWASSARCRSTSATTSTP